MFVTKTLEEGQRILREASGQHKKKLVKANLPPCPAIAQIISFFGLPKRKPTAALPVPSVIPRPLQRMSLEDLIIDVDAGPSPRLFPQKYVIITPLWASNIS
jgi:hypothetical protein